MAKSAAAELTLDRSASHLLHRALQLALDIYGAETGAGAITQRQFAVLAAAGARDGCTQSDLVKATGIDRSTLAELVGRLTSRGLIARERSASDGRANTVRLTDEGRSVLEGATPKVAAADARILGLLPAGKRDSFLKILRDMGRPHEVKAKKAKPEKAEKKKKKKAKKAKKAALTQAVVA
jgi:DNA-binding MarR family transcriptional regulator